MGRWRYSHAADSKRDPERKRFGVFNDIFRDAIKGSVFNADYGYIQGNKDPGILEKIRGDQGQHRRFRGQPPGIDQLHRSP